MLDCQITEPYYWEVYDEPVCEEPDCTVCTYEFNTSALTDAEENEFIEALRNVLARDAALYLESDGSLEITANESGECVVGVSGRISEEANYIIWCYAKEYGADICRGN